MLLACALAQAAAIAQPSAIDTGKSTITVRVFKAGVFSSFGHDHEIAGPIASGSVDAHAAKVQLQVKSSLLQVRDPDASAKDRADVQHTMAGPEVLDVTAYPEIAFHSTTAEPAGEGAWTVRGNLTLHGQTRPVVVNVQGKDGHYTGTAQFKQTEFGIKPVKVAGGAVRVKDEVRIEFDVWVKPLASEAARGKKKSS
jgi:polyisoprenoid-binding protein YceI